MLIAHYARNGFTPSLNINVELNNLSATGFISNGDTVKITAYKIPNDSVSAVTSLPVLGQQSLVYTGQNISFPLPALAIKEAYWLSITKGSLPTSIDETFIPVKDITLFPNPVKNNLTVQCEEQLCDILIYDSFGRQVYIRRIAIGITEINLAHLQPGFYFVQIINGTEIFTQKIVKE